MDEKKVFHSLLKETRKSLRKRRRKESNYEDGRANKYLRPIGCRLMAFLVAPEKKM